MDDAAPPHLPPVHEALLDLRTVDQLFADIATTTELLSVTMKGGATHRASPLVAGSADELERARRALLAGEIRGVQIRYLHDGKEWWDTLMLTREGVKLIRIDHQLALTPPPGSDT
jgi:hypothetical protein